MKHLLTRHPLAAPIAEPCRPAHDGERSSALKPSVGERLERASWRFRPRGIERACGDATAPADLEAKPRLVERRTLSRYY